MDQFDCRRNLAGPPGGSVTSVTRSRAHAKSRPDAKSVFALAFFSTKMFGGAPKHDMVLVWGAKASRQEIAVAGWDEARDARTNSNVSGGANT